MALSKFKILAVILTSLIISLGMSQSFAWVLLSNFCRRIGDQNLCKASLASSLCAGLGAALGTAFLVTKERFWSPIASLVLSGWLVAFSLAGALPMLLVYCEYSTERLVGLMYAANLTSLSLISGETAPVLRRQKPPPLSAMHLLPHEVLYIGGVKPDGAYLHEVAAFVSIQVNLCASNTALIAVLLILVSRLLYHQSLLAVWRHHQEERDRQLGMQHHNRYHHYQEAEEHELQAVHVQP